MSYSTEGGWNIVKITSKKGYIFIELYKNAFDRLYVVTISFYTDRKFIFYNKMFYCFCLRLQYNKHRNVLWDN